MNSFLSSVDEYPTKYLRVDGDKIPCGLHALINSVPPGYLGIVLYRSTLPAKYKLLKSLCFIATIKFKINMSVCVHDKWGINTYFVRCDKNVLVNVSYLLLIVIELNSKHKNHNRN